jgi:hypothetical protein
MNPQQRTHPFFSDLLRVLLAVVCTSLVAAGGRAADVSKPARINAPAEIRLLERGAILAEDFEGPKLDETRWRVWQMTADRTAVRQQHGRLEITARGPVRMEGLAGLTFAKYKDVVLVGEMDVRSRGPAPHQLALHLCGGDGKRSPDNWVELRMVDLGATVQFVPGVSIPPEFSRFPQQLVELPHPPGRGFLCQVALDANTNLATMSVRTTEGWQRICDPVELPLRTVHTEVKFKGQRESRDPGETSSEAWFDNVRLYPRPETHHVGIRLVDARGDPIWFRRNGSWPPSVVAPDGHEHSITDLEVQLRTKDGKTVATARTEEFAFFLLPLRHAPWDVYPVAAEIIVTLAGKPLGPPLAIYSGGVNGLYPDDVYEVSMR